MVARRSTGSATWPPTTRTAPSRSGPPDRDEGYLYWAAWLGHNGNRVFSAGDGNGFYRRIYLTIELRPDLDDRRSAQPAGAAR